MRALLYRIDERLIHGQVMAVWLGKIGANTVVIVDEVSAKDDFMKQVYQMAAPANVKVECVGIEDFRAMMKEEDHAKAIILFKGPKEAKAALEAEIPAGELIVGNVATAPGRIMYTKYAYFSKEEKEMLHTLQQLGWTVNMQRLPDENKILFDKNN